ncbi:MAG: hypothetical protein IJT82_02225 [Schwartzia sp.]|nr:hypothetical protein [Schwartzia sp. (in: firmicutes)]
MRVIGKYIVDGVRYMVWDEAESMTPGARGIAMLLSSRDGVGADYLISVSASGDITAYDRNGEMRETDSVMRMVALHGSGSAISGVRIDYVEVRLTDSFARKIEDASESMRVAV